MKLTVRDADHGTREYDLDRIGKDTLSFGRVQDCDIVLRSSFVSRPHGVIYKENGHWYIQDTKSTFGTFYMNRKIEKMEIENGTVIRLYSEQKDDQHCVEMRFIEDVKDSAFNTTSVTAKPSAPETAVRNPEPEEEAEYTTYGNTESTLFAVISLITAILALISVITISKTGAWLPILFGVASVTFGVLTIVLKRDGKGMAIAGLSLGGVALTLALIICFYVGTIGSFWWAKEGRGFPLYKTMSKMFDPERARLYDLENDILDYGIDYMEDLLDN